MADKSVSIDLIIKSSEAASSLKEVKQSLKDIKDEMIKAGEGTPAFNKLAAAAGQLKDKVDDANDAIKATNPNKFQALASFAGAAASGVAAVTGAMGLFGAESEEVTKTLAKVQSAMALSQGLAGLSELPKAWNSLKAAMSSTALVQKIVTAGQWLWNAAIMANPIGAIVAGVAALTAGIYLLVSALSSEESENDKVSRSLADLEKARDRNNDQIDHQLRLQKALGVSGTELKKLELKAITDKIAALDKEQAAYRKLTEHTDEQNAADVERGKKLQALLDEQSIKLTENIVFEIDEQAKKAAAEKKIADDKKAKNSADYKARREEKAKSDKAEADDKAKIDEEYRLSNLTAEEKSFDDFYKAQKVFLDNKNITQKEFDQKLIDRQAGIDALRLEAGKKANADAAALDKADREKKFNEILSDQEKIITDSQTSLSLKLDALNIENEAIKLNQDLTDEQREKKIQDNEDRKVAITKAARQAEAKIAMDLAVTSIAGLQTLSDLAFASKLSKTKKGSKEEEEVMRKQFKANKALNLSTAIINAAQAQLSILAQYPKFDGGFAMVAAMVGAGITSLASIAKIAATQFDTTSAGGNEPPPSLNAAAATATSNSQPSTLLNPDGTVNNQNTPTPAPIQVYVVESDITSTQTQVAVVQNQMNFQ